MSDIKLDSSIMLPTMAGELFAIWTDTKQMARWYAPSDEVELVEIDWDLRVGGGYRFGFRTSDGRIDRLHGEFREVSAPGRLCFTWVWDRANKQEENNTLVEIDFAQSGSQTELRLQHSGFLMDKERDMHKWGWDNILAALKRELPNLTT